ncbi:thioredoxin family protein [Shewanella frigidimarina]|jgi:small redox-active disulfide protein 2|uniref:thioredoxin family protein n=1 Tax=Shewanella TaxID=22 RepID=UPI000C34AF05|nr:MULTISPECIES: thioredoxin family protein [Shewanella]MBB1382128.1 thioredoxin family protein [Shewanella sp. SR41-2]MBB1426479.1 thioredoxin family protein [Shewanella sp. SG44-2]PKH29990.1 thioredoxin family protein [Shewanella sp. ALD9]PKI05255.1 thioredoxin family protein [Shewanella sp. 11B5]RPA32647.1 thioredoxin family protein [Shewanella frigidimarina]|tara:strand:+ start:9967 stop:10197 length:231 start_codon:yes stop_codon:yes gene_type:complete
MKIIKVLGSGCKKCLETAELAQAVADEKGVAIKIEKVTDMAQIMAYDVMSTPAVVVDEKVVHKGSKPTKDQMAMWI